jgi:peptide/nickel transport system substrate-binding protein
MLETLGGLSRSQTVARDSTLALVPYASATYGFLGFQIRKGPTNAPHPIFADAATRRALALAVDRTTLARSVFGREAKAPPGPMSGLLWIGSDSIASLPFDTARAARALDAAGWRERQAGQQRQQNGRALAFDILVPSTSPVRRQLAVELQSMWRNVGAAVTVTAVDFPLFQERLEGGRFDTYIGAWLDEPSARGLADQWTRAGWGGLNYGRYANPAFDTLFIRASRASEVHQARRLYREAMDSLNTDAPALFLYSPVNLAVLSRRVQNVQIAPFSWASGLRQWQADNPF